MQIDELARGQINGHRVDRQIASSQVKGDVGDQLDPFRTASVDVGAVDAKRGRLEGFTSTAGLQGDRPER